MSPAAEKYRAMINGLRAEGLTLGLRALREMYGNEAGEVIYALQQEIDRLTNAGTLAEQTKARERYDGGSSY
jgi:hypothetical protein